MIPPTGARAAWHFECMPKELRRSAKAVYPPRYGHVRTPDDPLCNGCGNVKDSQGSDGLWAPPAEAVVSSVAPEIARLMHPYKVGDLVRAHEEIHFGNAPDVVIPEGARGRVIETNVGSVTAAHRVRWLADGAGAVFTVAWETVCIAECLEPAPS